jgi:D-arabinose 1-dehydrogenase-like Zn-dependent alcohol dehydrogenase
LQAVRYGGTVTQIGVLSQSEQPLPIPLILHRQVRIQGIYVGSKSHFEAMNRAIVAARMQPVVDQIYTFDRVREALKSMETGSHFGKIVIRVVA